MASIALTQSKESIDSLGSMHFDDNRGHNTLSADISGSNLSHAWIEVSLNELAFQEYVEFTASDYKIPLNNAADGTAISNISVRECQDIRYVTEDRDRLVMVYGEDGSPGQTIKWAESTNADKTAFDNVQTAYNATYSQAEDPNWFYDQETGKLHMFVETQTSPNKVSVLDAVTDEGQSYDNETLIGGDSWTPGDTFHSPTAWRHNGNLFIAGEEHDTTEKDLMIAKGTGPRSWDKSIISMDVADYSSIDKHINLQSLYIDRTGRLHAYTNNLQSDGNWATRYVWTESYDTDGFPVENWNLPTDRTTGKNIGLMFRDFNEMWVYGYDKSDQTQILYWELPGSRIDKTLASDGGSVSWEFYEPTAPSSSTIDWRVAVEDANGNVERSSSKRFYIGSAPDKGGPYVTTKAGARQTVDGVVQTNTK